MKLVAAVIQPNAHAADLLLHPVGRAAWVGLFATALNLLPVGQLDGGHILRSVSPRAHGWISLLLPIILVLLGMFVWRGWLLWAAILLGLRFLRIAPIYDPTPLDPNRRYGRDHCAVGVCAVLYAQPVVAGLLQILPEGRMPESRPQHKLARILRERDLLLLFVGSVIGSGIFLTPALILRQVGGSVGSSLLVWLLGGVLSLLGALTYAELAAANPEAGGLYCYIRDGFGRLPAFLVRLVPVPGDCQRHDCRAGPRVHKLSAGDYSTYLAAGVARSGADDRRRDCREHLGHAQKFRFAERHHADQSRHHRGARRGSAGARVSPWPSRR